TELDADLKHAAAAAASDGVEAERAGPSIGFDPAENYFQFKARARMEYFTEMYKTFRGSLTRAAKRAGVAKSTVYNNLLPEYRKTKEKATDAGLDGDAAETA